MGFVRWESEDAALAEFTALGHSKEDAAALVDEIRARARDGKLHKAMQPMQVIAKADNGDIVVYGPCSWELVDPEGDYVTTKAMSGFFHTWFSKVPEDYRCIMVDHQNFKGGKPLLSYKAGDVTYRTHVHEKGAMLVSIVRPDDGLGTTKRLRKAILDGVYKSYSIAGLPTVQGKQKVGDVEANVIDELEPYEVTYCQRGMNPKANFGLVGKAEGGPEFDNFEDCMAWASKQDGIEDPEGYCASKCSHKAYVAWLYLQRSAQAKAMTLQQIEAKIKELQGKRDELNTKLSDYYKKQPEAPAWVRSAYEQLDALYEEMRAYREAKVQVIVQDATGKGDPVLESRLKSLGSKYFPSA